MNRQIKYYHVVVVPREKENPRSTMLFSAASVAGVFSELASRNFAPEETLHSIEVVFHDQSIEVIEERAGRK